MLEDTLLAYIVLGRAAGMIPRQRPPRAPECFEHGHGNGGDKAAATWQPGNPVDTTALNLGMLPPEHAALMPVGSTHKARDVGAAQAPTRQMPEPVERGRSDDGALAIIMQRGL